MNDLEFEIGQRVMSLNRG